MVVHGPPRWWVKLADFGLSKRLTECSVYHTKSGTRFYMAPEILGYLSSGNSSTRYTNAVDIWALGCIAYRLLTGDVPFRSDKSLIKFCEGRLRFTCQALLESSVGETCTNFVRTLLTTSPNDRPSATQALDDTWVASGTPRLSFWLTNHVAPCANFIRL